MSDSPALSSWPRGLAAVAGVRAADLGPPDAWRTQGLTTAQLHEIYAGDTADGPAAIGFAVALALIAGALPILWVRIEADEARAGRLHASGLAEIGLSPDALVLVLVPDATALLRVAADAARCSGLGMVMVERWGPAPEFDLTATRRLMLAAERSGATVLSVRGGAQPVPSAAATRWGVAAAPSLALEAQAPGLPAFDVECLRRRGGPAGSRWRVEWNRDDRCFNPAPLVGTGISPPAGRPAARDAPAPVRRTG